MAWLGGIAVTVFETYSDTTRCYGEATALSALYRDVTGYIPNGPHRSSAQASRLYEIYHRRSLAVASDKEKLPGGGVEHMTQFPIRCWIN